VVQKVPFFDANFQSWEIATQPLRCELDCSRVCVVTKNFDPLSGCDRQAFDQRVKQRSITCCRIENTYRSPRRKRSDPDHLVGDKFRERRWCIGCACGLLLVDLAISLVLSQGRASFMFATHGHHDGMAALMTPFGVERQSVCIA